jgi:hypothetical protein
VLFVTYWSLLEQIVPNLILLPLFILTYLDCRGAGSTVSEIEEAKQRLQRSVNISMAIMSKGIKDKS